ncbi:MAG: hypothetical protein AAB656_00945 [Patescibacteria group bacterium]
MTIFIERLREIKSQTESDNSYSKSSEPIVKPENESFPKTLIVLTGVTLGKELHAGHILLLTVADLINSGLGSENSVFILNNNTGPRPAGALLALSKSKDLGIEQAATLMDNGQFSVQEVQDAYRSRSLSDEDIDSTIDFLDQSDLDIFSVMSTAVASSLTRAGYDIEILSESKSIKEGEKVIESIDPVWQGSGFIAHSSKNALRILQKGGHLTATGKGVASMVSIANKFAPFGVKPFIIYVDSSPDTFDSTFTFSALGDFGEAIAIPGSGVSFNGKIASGTKGEALTISQILDQYSKSCPANSISLAFRHFVLTSPIMIIPKAINIGEMLFDFKDNDSFLRALIASYDGALKFKVSIEHVIENLKGKIGETTNSSNPKTQKWLDFIPQKAKALESIKIDQVLGASKTLKPITSPGEIVRAVKNQGFTGFQAISKIQEYLKGQKTLTTRGNYFKSIVDSIISTETDIIEVSTNDFKLILNIIEVCLRRMGYE